MNKNIEANRDFLNLFWDLASDDAEKRIPAGKKIVEYTLHPKEDQVGVDKSYTIKRLVKGLSSSRDSARLGFAGKFPITKISLLYFLSKFATLYCCHISYFQLMEPYFLIF